jgi:hypothetical protein
MITISAQAQSLLTGSYGYACAVESWYDGQLLAADIPVFTAAEEVDRTVRVPERVTFTVPREAAGVSWSPVSDRHPLAANGQRLHVKLGIRLDSDRVEWFERGRFLIQTSFINGNDEVQVEALGLKALVDEAKLVSPYQPSGTLVSTLRGLVEPALTVVVDAALTDRAVPSGINYDEDRLGAVLELLDAWPADAYVTPAGYLAVVPATQSTTSVLSLTTGTGGTVITATGSSTRDGAYNAVVARGTATDGGQVQGVAYDMSGGPKGYGGPFNPLPVPYYFTSPLLTTVIEAQRAAETIMARFQRGTARQFDIDMVPHPALQAGDVVSVTTDDVTDLLCSVEAFNLPYKATGGSQRVTVRSLVTV